MREMKDSGIKWIGEIPKEWEVNFLSSLFFEQKQKNKGMAENNLLSLSYGNIIKKSIETREGLLPESFENYNIIDKGDIVFRLTDLQNDKRSLRTGLCKEHGIITSAYVTIRNKISLNQSFYHFLFHTYDICKVYYGMGDGVRQGMNFSDLKKLQVICPPLSEQQRIATYLDTKCGEIDELIGIQEKFIEELKAYKQSVITEAVTKGLNPNAKMKDCGVEWIGEIPEEWNLERFKYICKINGRVGFKGYSKSDLVAKGEGAFTIGGKHISKNCIDLSNPDYISWEKYYESPEIMVHEGDIITAQRGTLGKAAIVDSYIGEATINPSLVLINNIKICAKYLYWYLISNCIQTLIDILNTSTAVPMISQNQIENFFIPLGRIDEQQQIATYLDNKCTQIDSLIALKQTKIDELKSFKKSLIYEYVTGKKTVPETV